MARSAPPNQSLDSSRAGWLQARERAGDYPGEQINPQIELQNYLQQWVAGVAYLDGTLVRPAWQREPANLPTPDTDWAALAIQKRVAFGPFGAVIHHGGVNPWRPTVSTDPDRHGYDEMQRHETLTVLISFYGPNADTYASNLHDGLMVWQNRAPLLLVGMGFVEIQDSIHAPEFIRQQWWNRTDKTLVVNRIIRRSYPVLDIASSTSWVMTDQRGGTRTVVRVPPINLLPIPTPTP